MIRPTTVTSTVDGFDHLVTAAAASVGLMASHGTSVASCGRLVLAALLTVPPWPTCLDCQTAAPYGTDGATAAATQLTHWFAFRVRQRASGGAGVMRWCVASFADRPGYLRGSMSGVDLVGVEWSWNGCPVARAGMWITDEDNIGGALGRADPAVDLAIP